jgi:hypothetical protein
MALKNQPEYSKTPPAFESETTTQTTTEKEDMTKTIDNTANASVAATTAIAKAAAGTAVGAVRPKLSIAFADSKDVFDTATVSALSNATPRITAEQGSLKKDRATKLGVSIDLEVVSWNHRWAIGCGEDKMNDEMKQLFRVSYDNQTVDGEGGSVAAYIESLKAQGYPKAKVSPYGDLFGYIVAIDGKEVPVEDRELALVQLASTSLGNFTAFCVSRGLLESRGSVQHSDVITLTATDRVQGANSFTNIAFKAAK